MSNSKLNRVSGTSHSDKEHENLMSDQQNEDSNKNKDIDEKLSKSIIEITTDNDKNKKIEEDNIKIPLTVKRDIVIELVNEVLQNDDSNKQYKPNHGQDTFPQKYFKFGIKDHGQDNLYNHANMKTWVQYSLGQGRGFGKGTSDSDRNNFILLVMVIVLVMLLITSAWVIFVFTEDSLFKIFRRSSLFLSISASVGLMMVYYAMICIKVARQPPCGFIMLILTVVLMCILAGAVTCRFETIIIFYAFVATSAVVFVCVLLACTSFDFTSLILYFVVISVSFGVVAMFLFIGMLILGTYIKTVHIIILCITVLLQSVGLVMELQMILGGRTVELEENEYCLASFLLYTSIVKMFLNLVQLIGILDHD